LFHFVPRRRDAPCRGRRRRLYVAAGVRGAIAP
jgi:hypothetical protein